MVATRSRRSTSKAITYVVVNKFQGGINAQPDKVQLPMGFTPMARNVEWMEQGGFYVRKGVGRLIYGAFSYPVDAPPAVPSRFYHYVRDPTVSADFVSQYLLATTDGKVYVASDTGPVVTGTEGQWQGVSVAGTPLVTLGPPQFTAWDQNVYLSLGEQTTSALGQVMHRWNGTTCAPLGTAWSNDIAAPTGGNMPPARYLAAWSERMWVGCTVPGAVEPSMIRWSHPGRPEDWAEGDYIRVGQAGDVITGIAPMRDMLIVFKRSSMYALLGSGSTNFRVVELSGTIGCTGEWTLDNQGRVVFWDGSIGACRFDGKNIDHLFAPLLRFLTPGPQASIHRCGGVVTDGEKIYVATDFIDFYGDSVPIPLTRLGRFGRKEPKTDPPAGALIPGHTRWTDLTTNGVTWAVSAGVPWLSASVEFYNLVWVYRDGAGWTSFTLDHPEAKDITMLGQIRSRMTATGDVESNRRIVYGLSKANVTLYLSDRYDDGRDWWSPEDADKGPIDAFYMTPWLHGGLPAQVKRWKAPRIIQEADNEGVLLIDVYYDFNIGPDFLRRTLQAGVVHDAEHRYTFDSYVVNKPGTVGRAKAVLLVIRAEHARHWGVSSITIPVHPKVLR